MTIKEQTRHMVADRGQEVIAPSRDETYLNCLRCGLCLPSCPVYLETLLEPDSPRGRVALARGAKEGHLALTPKYAERINRCTLCAACEAICPSGVEVEELLLKVREKLAEEGLLSPGVRRLADAVQQMYNISGEENRRRLIWTENMGQRPSGIGVRQAELVYFVGCVSSFFPASYSIPQAFVRLLEAAGTRYALLGEEEACCGYPLLASGLANRGEELIAHNIRRVRELGANTLVASCPSCYYMWRSVYPKVAGDIGLRVLHATEWLAEALEEGKLKLRPLPGRATYHDPCDLGRKSGLYGPPRQILRQIPGLELVEMRDHHANSLCCGGGGNLESQDPELVAALAERRVRQALAVGAEWLVSACQQCKRTLANAARRVARSQGGKMVRVVDLTELAERQIES